MIREDKAFVAILTSVGSHIKDEDVLMKFTLQHTCMGEVQTFLNTYEDKCDLQNIKSLFASPVWWKSISIEAGYKFDIEFNELDQFEARLTEIKVKRKYVKGEETYVYDLVFLKEFDKELDAVFVSHLKQKEDNDEGRRVLVDQVIYLTPTQKQVDKLTSEQVNAD